MSVINAGFVSTSQRITTTDSINQWDYGMSLQVTGLPAITGGIEFQFAFEHENEDTTENIAGNMVGQTASVAIPDKLLERNGMLLAYLYVTETATPAGTTERIIRIPVAMRQRPAMSHTPDTNAWAGFLQSISTERSKFDDIIANVESINESILNHVAHLNMAYIFRGSTTFAAIPTIGLLTGDTWNVEDAFTSDSRFRDHIGTRYPAGSTIVYTAEGKWDTIDTNAYFSLDELADAYSQLTTYKKYDFCVNNSQLFIFKSETPYVGIWDASMWEPTDIGKQLSILYNGVTKAGKRITLAEYDALTTEKQNDGTLYLITDDDGVEFITMSITQAEFDNLSQAQKDDGTLWDIVDGGDGNTNAELRTLIDGKSKMIELGRNGTKTSAAIVADFSNYTEVAVAMYSTQLTQTLEVCRYPIDLFAVGKGIRSSYYDGTYKMFGLCVRTATGFNIVAEQNDLASVCILYGII